MMPPGNPSRTSPTPPTSLPILKHRGRCFPRGGSDVTVWPHNSLTPPQEPTSARTDPLNPKDPDRRLYPLIGGCLFFLIRTLSRFPLSCSCRISPRTLVRTQHI